VPAARSAEVDLVVKSSESALDPYELTQITGSAYEAPVYQVSVDTAATSLVIQPGSNQFLSRISQLDVRGGLIHESIVPDWVKKAWWLAYGCLTLESFLSYNGYTSLDDMMSDYGDSTLEEFLLNNVLGFPLADLPQYGFNFTIVPDADHYNVTLSDYMVQNWPAQMDGAGEHYDSTAQYAFIYIRHFSNDLSSMIEETPTLDAVLVVKIGGTSTPVGADKTTLQTAINNAPTTGYYTTGDRYNGKGVSIGGFWADFQTALTTAQAVSDSTAATQAQVDQATANLTAAIAKLIPKTNVNATLLYEAVQSAKLKKETDYSTSSWANMQAELTTSEEMLGALYDDGGPTELNTAGYQDEVDGQTAALTAAANDLDKVAGSYKLLDAQLAYDGIPALTNKLFNPGSMTASDYTPESYGAFASARTAALEFRGSHQAPAEGIGNKAAQEYIDAYAALWNACYKGLTSAGGVAVSLSIVDNYAVYKDEPAFEPAGTYGELSLEAGAATLDGALTEALGAGYSTALPPGRSGADCFWGVYVNGIFMQDPQLSCANPPHSAIQQATDIQLHDGDDVVLVLMAVPTYTNLSGSLTTYSLMQLGAASVKHHRLLQGGKAVSALSTEAGKAFNLTAMTQAALPSNYIGRESPLSGTAVYLSERFATEAEARSAAPAADTGVVTGTDGSFTYTLYAEGWYALCVFDKSEYGALSNGSPIVVHVTESSDPATVKAALKAELEAVYNAYDQEYYTPESWTSIQDYYQAGLAGIKEAKTLGEAGQAQRTAISEIKKIQDAATDDNTTKLSAFRNVLDRLPDDLSLLGSSLEHLITGYSWTVTTVQPDGQTTVTEYHNDGLLEQYAALTKWQKNQLTGAEQAKYDSVVEAHDKGLPELDPYQLNLRVEAGSEEAEAALADMIAYLQEHGCLGVSDENALNTFSTQLRRPDAVNLIGSLEKEALTSYPDRWVTLMFDPGYAAYELLDPDGINGGPHTISHSGEGWTWSLDGSKMSHSDYTNYYELLENATITVNSEEYEIKSVKLEGVDDYSLSYARMLTKFSADGTTVDRTLRVPEALYSFVMPYNDVKVTVTWGPVAGSEEVQAAKDAARTVVETAYSGYSQSDYSAANWMALTAAKDAGLAAIDAAADFDGIAAERKAALAAMAAVKTIAQEEDDSEETGGVSGVPLPDYGDVVGRVHIIVENQTFTSAASHGGLPGWYGTLVDGWYNLRERDTMMTAVLKTLQLKGCRWTAGSYGDAWDNYDISYLATINAPASVEGDGDDFYVAPGGGKLGEFSGEQGSGWMGTLNDWFTNLGFTEFSYRNGGLSNGDTIHVQFTQDYGEDLSGTWGNSDTSLKDLEVSAGTITPALVPGAAPGGSYEYALVIPGDSASVKITPTAANKNYLVKTFLNKKVTDNKEDSSFYKRTETIPVQVGDTVYIGVGEYAWPSMNNQETETRDYTGTWYELHVISASNGAGYVNDLFTRLPAAEKITSGNFESHRGSIEYARAVYEALDPSEQEKVDTAKLTAAEEKIAFFDQIGEVKTLMEAIPRASTITEENMKAIADQVLEAEAAYKELSSEQKLYITVGLVANYNATIERLNELGAFDPGDEPTPIEKNELETLLAEALQIENVGYSEESWANFTAALQAAQAVNAKENATQEEIDAACEALTNAKAQLVLIDPAVKKVDDLIAKISDPITLADKEAIEEARAAYNALTEEQKKLVTKLDQLKAAEAKLAELQAADKPAPSPEDDKNKPAADGKQIKAGQTGTGSATGDPSTATTTAAFLLIALCAGGYLYSKKRREESRV
jgi:hypothetical protein